MDKDKKEKVKNKFDDITNINVVTGYCSKCLKEISENDKDVTRDHDGNWFCNFECKKYYFAEIRRELDGRFREWRNWGG